MRKYFISAIILLLFPALLSGQNNQKNKYDYIESGYYQLIYEAEIAHLEGNDSLAFAKLQQAESVCPLINQFPYREIELYCRLLMKNGQFNKAIAYMDTLANKYGKFPTDVLIDIGKDENLSKNLLKEVPDFYLTKMPKLLEDSEWYYASLTHDSIINILTDISAADQNVRMSEEKPPFSPEFIEKMRETDISNYNRLFQFIDKFGFPNTRLFGSANTKMEGRLYELFMHITDHINIQDTILQLVRAGQCPPDLYGIVVNRRMLPNYLREYGKRMFLYDVLSNPKDDDIIDIEHLDERHIAAGLPTRAMNQKRIELLMRKYEDYVLPPLP